MEPEGRARRRFGGKLAGIILGQRVSELRRGLGLDREQVARGIGMELRAYEMCEAGLVSFSDDQRQRLGDFLGVDFEALAGGAEIDIDAARRRRARQEA